jgi:hypothetical protein
MTKRAKQYVAGNTALFVAASFPGFWLISYYVLSLTTHRLG